MTNPLMIAALVLAGVSAAGLVIDARAACRPATRTFGISAIVMKCVLLIGFVGYVLQSRILPTNTFEVWGAELTSFALVAVGVPLVGAALACELAAMPRLHERPNPREARATNGAPSSEDA